MSMKAVRVHGFGAPDVLKVEENVTIPQPNDDQVLVKVVQAGVNPVDAWIRAGLFPVPTLKFPYTPGADLAGVVEKVGVNVKGLKTGDRVYATACVSGAYAQYAVVNGHNVWPLEDKVSFAQGAAMGVPYFTAYRALFFKCHSRPGETLLVHGASGAVGTAACQIAHSIGMKVIGTAGTDDGLKLAKECGADHVFNHRENGYEAKIGAATGGKGVNVILEMLADKNLNADLAMLAIGGRVCVIGTHGTVPQFDSTLVLGKEAIVVGVLLGHTTPAEWNQMGNFFAAGFRQGWLKPVVEKCYTLSTNDVVQVHKDVMEHTNGTKGKLTIDMCGMKI